MSDHHKLSRRNFLGTFTMGCASLSVTPLYSGITNLGLMNAAASANRPLYSAGNDYKAMICIFLQGGNDSFNMLVPRGQSEYDQYSAVRGNMALNRSDLLAIEPTNVAGKEYGLHPAMSNTQNLFQAGNAAFVANVGTLLAPTTIANFNTVNKPSGLYSHFDQSIHWHTGLPQNLKSSGWGGRLADILHTNNANQDISMNISLSGINIFQQGNVVKEYTISALGNGSVTLTGADNNDLYNRIKRQTLDNLLDQSHHNILKQAYSNTVGNSNNNAFGFASAIGAVQEFSTQFSTDSLSKKLKMVAKTIAARDTLGAKNQIFFIEHAGFDQHNDLLVDHQNRLTDLDNAIGSFNAAMEEIGTADCVVGFTMSDFARTLGSNGDGTDHGWGGNALVWGNPVNGKKIYGEYPELYIDNPQDIGGGRLIPTTSCDEYFAELALWLGASSSDMDQILPNIRNFWTPDSTGPLGMFA